MNISSKKILLFFVTTLILGWFLYPREIFMAYIHEGKSELKAAEAKYLKVIHENPDDKETRLKLTSLYERMGEPEKATVFMKDVFESRKSDWNFAVQYMDFLDRTEQHEELYKTQQKILDLFEGKKYVPKKDYFDILETVYAAAVYRQDTQTALKFLAKQEKLFPKSTDSIENKILIFKANKKVDQLLEIYNQRLQNNPKDTNALFELWDIYMGLQNYQKAETMINALIKLEPQNTEHLMAKYSLLMKIDKKDQAFDLLKAILKLKTINDDLRQTTKANMAAIYRAKGQNTQALQIYSNLYSLNPENLEYLKEMIYTLLDLGQNKEALPYIEAYLQKEPEDLDLIKVVIETDLYERKTLAHMNLLLLYLNETSDQNIIIDVAYLMIDQKKLEEAESWMARFEGILQSNFKYIETRAVNLISLKRASQAEHWLRQLFNKQPHKKDWAELLLYSLRLQNKRLEAHHLLQSISQKNPHSANWQNFVGENYIYLSWLHHAKPHFEKSLQIKEAALPHYFLSEIYYAMGQREHFPKQAKLFLKAKHTLPKNLIWTKRILSTQAKLKFKKSHERQFKKLIQKHPKDAELVSMYANLLMDNRRWKKAEKVLYDHAPLTPNSQMLTSQARLHNYQKEFETAIQEYQSTLKLEPDNIYIQNDLAQTHNQIHEWKEALKILESIFVEDRAQFFIAQNKQNIWLNHHNQISNTFHFVDQDQVSFYENTLEAKFNLSDRLQIHPEYTFGFFNDDTINHTAIAKQALIGLKSFHVNQTEFEIKAGYGETGTRRTPSFGLNANRNFQYNFSGSLNTQIRQVRRDISQAVFAQALQDEVEASFSYLPRPWWILTGTYQFRHTDLKTGERQYEQLISPTISRVLWNIPYISLGYQMSYSRADGDQSFLNSLPVIPESFAHYLNVIIRHHFTENMTAQAQAFVGEDFKRKLSLFQGELWGTSAAFQWHFTKHNYLQINYQFGQETLAGLGGENHDIKIQLLGHW